MGFPLLRKPVGSALLLHRNPSGAKCSQMVSCTLVSSSHGAHNIRNRGSSPETFFIVYFLIGTSHTSPPLWLPFVENENLMLESH